MREYDATEDLTIVAKKVNLPASIECVLCWSSYVVEIQRQLRNRSYPQGAYK